MIYTFNFEGTVYLKRDYAHRSFLILNEHLPKMDYDLKEHS